MGMMRTAYEQQSQKLANRNGIYRGSCSSNHNLFNPRPTDRTLRASTKTAQHDQRSDSRSVQKKWGTT